MLKEFKTIWSKAVAVFEGNISALAPRGVTKYHVKLQSG
jgi:hypothetical protein